MNPIPRKRSSPCHQPLLPGCTASAGIDVSKKNFHVCLLTRSGARPQKGSFSADADGHRKFTGWLQRVSGGETVHCCLEETGTYGRALAAFLHEGGHFVSVVNAALIKHYGRSLNVRTKNDVVDARLIAQYTLERVPARWRPLAPAHEALRAASRRRQQIISLMTAEKNHLEAATDPAVRASIEHLLTLLHKEQEKIMEQMERLAAEDPVLAHNRSLLDSIPGIGALTALLLLAELPALDSFESARQLCAYAGLTPRERQSGTSVHGRNRLCKQGRGGLRSLLFLPAASLLSCKSGPLKAFAQKLINAGKAPKCAVGALMRKLMALTFAILRSGKAYNPQFHLEPSGAPALHQQKKCPV
jgi:transposase